MDQGLYLFQPVQQCGTVDDQGFVCSRDIPLAEQVFEPQAEKKVCLFQVQQIRRIDMIFGRC